jgi:hypothetical protein
MLGEIAWRPLSRSLLVVSPSIALSIVSGDIRWLTTTALVSMCVTIVEERLFLAPFGVLLHGVAIMAGFVTLVAASVSPILFVALCAIMAATSIWLTTKGHALRSLGNFTFIPALYLANDVVETAATQGVAAATARELPYMIAGLIPVFILAASRRPALDPPSSFLTLGQRARLRLSHKTDYGERRLVVEACLAVACAVGLAATLVEWQALDHGQWVIWSAASVVTGEAGTEHRKFRDRTIGALIGVPAGIAVGWGLPHTALVFGASVLAGLLTLIAFRRYVFGFSARCAFIALALTVGGQAMSVAGERILNVILGGLIGLACVFVFRWFSRIRKNRRCPQSPSGVSQKTESRP